MLLVLGPEGVIHFNKAGHNKGHIRRQFVKKIEANKAERSLPLQSSLERECKRTDLQIKSKNRQTKTTSS